MKVLEEAAASAGKMSCHNDADAKVTELKVNIRVIVLRTIDHNIYYRE